MDEDDDRESLVSAHSRIQRRVSGCHSYLVTTFVRSSVHSLKDAELHIGTPVLDEKMGLHWF